jgi:hypothetical protein
LLAIVIPPANKYDLVLRSLGRIFSVRDDGVVPRERKILDSAHPEFEETPPKLRTPDEVAVYRQREWKGFWTIGRVGREWIISVKEVDLQTGGTDFIERVRHEEVAIEDQSEVGSRLPR